MSDEPSAFKHVSLEEALETGRLLDEEETAYLLHVEVATLRRWRWARKELPYSKVGGAVRYDPADVAAYKRAIRKEPLAA